MKKMSTTVRQLNLVFVLTNSSSCHRSPCSNFSSQLLGNETHKRDPRQPR